MKVERTFILLFTLLLSTTGIIAQSIEGAKRNSNFPNKKSLDASKTTLEIIKDDNTQSSYTHQGSNQPASNLIRYQAVVRNADGSLITNSAIKLDFLIHKATATGPVIYSETKNLTTDTNGAFSVQIGSLSPLAINLESDVLFLEVFLDGASLETIQFRGDPSAKSPDYINEGISNRKNSLTTSADVLELSGDNTQTGEILDIQATNVVPLGNDIINIEMPAGSSNDAQFIEARNGGSLKFQVQGDGRVRINTTTTDPVLNTVYGNSIPIAYGSVDLNGGVAAGYGIVSVAKAATGVYNIVITHTTDMDNSIVMITPFTAGLGTPEIAGYNATGPNSFTVYIQTVAGEGRDSAFSFVVYGNH